MMQHHELSRMSKNEKIAYVEKLLIYDPYFTDMIEMIEECRERSKVTIEPRCLFITGITGSGKTTLGEHILKKHPRSVKDEGTTVPVLMAKIFAPATVKSMATALLYRLGDPIPDKGTKTSQTLRLYKLLKECGVQLIIIDEFQHLYDRNSNRVLIDAADWLKDLLNEVKIPIVLLGMPWGKNILEMSSQLKRRFSAQRELPPFRWKTDEQKKYTMKFLNAVDKKLPFPIRSELGSEDIAFRIMCATRGKRSAVMLTIRRAAEFSIKRGLDQITMETLAKAYDAEIATLNLGAVNPFKVKRDKLQLNQISRSDDEYKMPEKEKGKSLKRAAGF